MISTDFFSCHSFILFLLVLSLIEAHTAGHTIGSPLIESCLVNFRAVFVWSVQKLHCHTKDQLGCLSEHSVAWE